MCSRRCPLRLGRQLRVASLLMENRLEVHLHVNIVIGVVSQRHFDGEAIAERNSRRIPVAKYVFRYPDKWTCRFGSGRRFGQKGGRVPPMSLWKLSGTTRPATGVMLTSSTP